MGWNLHSRRKIHAHVCGIAGVYESKTKNKNGMLRFASHYFASMLHKHCLPAKQESCDQISALLDSNERLVPWFPGEADTSPTKCNVF